MFNLDFKKAEGPEIKLPTSAGSSKRQESSRKTSISALLTMTKPLTVWITTNCGKFFPQRKNGKEEMGIPDHLICLLRNLYSDQEATVRTGHGTTDWFQIGKGVHQGCILSPYLFNLYAEYIHTKCWAGWSTSWNQDCQEKYKKLQMCRWHHPYGRKQKGTEKPLDESERGEWKSWLKTQHSKN